MIVSERWVEYTSSALRLRVVSAWYVKCWKLLIFLLSFENSMNNKRIIGDTLGYSLNLVL